MYMCECGHTKQRTIYTAAFMYTRIFFLCQIKFFMVSLILAFSVHLRHERDDSLRNKNPRTNTRTHTYVIRTDQATWYTKTQSIIFLLRTLHSKVKPKK